MKTIKYIFSYICFILTGFAFGATAIQKQIGNVANPASRHIVSGNVVVSGSQDSFTAYLDILLPNGKALNISEITVNGTGVYPVSEIINENLLPAGEAVLGFSADNTIASDNITLDLNISEFKQGEGASNSSHGGSSVLQIGDLSSSTFSISSVPELSVPSAPKITSGNSQSASAANLSAGSPKNSADITGSAGNIEVISYTGTNMVSGVNSNRIIRDPEGNILIFAQTASMDDVNNSMYEELVDVFGSKTAGDWQNFDWNSPITQAALNYLLAVHKGKIKDSINITADNAKTIRQSLLARMSYGNRSFINGCLSAYDLDFTGINLQNCDWRYRLEDLTPDQLLLSARSIKNAQNFYAGLQGACLPSVSFTGNEDFNGVSLAYVYIGNWTGFSAAQMKQVVKNKGGAVGIFLNEDQYNTWGSIIIGNSSIIFAFGKWNGLGYWEDVFNYMWNENSLDVTADGVVLNNPNQFIICTY